MSARRLLALLVVVLLGLLLASPTALSRSELPRYDVCDYGGPAYADDEDDNDDDPDETPNGFVGDDDNWDKRDQGKHHTAHAFGASGGASSSEDELSRVEVGLGVRLALLLQQWVLNQYAR